MVDLLFKCSACSKHLVVDDAGSGNLFECTDCRNEVRVPAGTTAFQCPSCTWDLLAPAELASEIFDCPNCSSLVTIPPPPDPLPLENDTFPSRYPDRGTTPHPSTPACANPRTTFTPERPPDPKISSLKGHEANIPSRALRHRAFVLATILTVPVLLAGVFAWRGLQRARTQRAYAVQSSIEKSRIATEEVSRSADERIRSETQLRIANEQTARETAQLRRERETRLWEEEETARTLARMAQQRSTQLATQTAVSNTLDTSTITTTTGMKYERCTITRVEPDGLSILHSRGAAKIAFTQLPSVYATRYGYDPAKATQYTLATLQQNAANAKTTAENNAKKRNESRVTWTQVTCSSCDGEGRLRGLRRGDGTYIPRACSRCGGSGHVREVASAVGSKSTERGSPNLQNPGSVCLTCQGSGRYFSSGGTGLGEMNKTISGWQTCPACNGKRRQPPTVGIAQTTVRMPTTGNHRHFETGEDAWRYADSLSRQNSGSMDAMREATTSGGGLVVGNSALLQRYRPAPDEEHPGYWIVVPFTRDQQPGLYDAVDDTLWTR